MTQHQFDLEHDEPHCFSCRKEIKPDTLVILRNVDGVIVWWHRDCAPPEKEKTT